MEYVIRSGFSVEWHTNRYSLVILCQRHPCRTAVIEFNLTQSAGAVEYTDCTSAEGLDPCNECPRYDTKQTDSEVPVMWELWGMQCTPSLPLLPGPIWPGVVAPDKGPIYGLNRTNYILMLNWIFWIRIVWLNWIAWNRKVFDYQTVLTFKLHASAKLICLKWNCLWLWISDCTKLIYLI